MLDDGSQTWLLIAWRGDIIELDHGCLISVQRPPASTTAYGPILAVMKALIYTSAAGPTNSPLRVRILERKWRHHQLYRVNASDIFVAKCRHKMFRNAANNEGKYIYSTDTPCLTQTPPHYLFVNILTYQRNPAVGHRISALLLLAAVLWALLLSRHSSAAQILRAEFKQLFSRRKLEIFHSHCVCRLSYFSL